MRYFGRLEGMSKKEVDHAIDHWLERLAIPEYKFKTAGELSKGISKNPINCSSS